MSNLIQRIKNQGIVLDGRLSVMSENLPQKYETDGTGCRLGDMDKGHWRRQPGSNGRQKRTAVLQLTVIQIIEKEVCSS